MRQFDASNARARDLFAQYIQHCATSYARQAMYDLSKMRRLIAMLLLVILCSSPSAPLFGLSPDANHTMAACRRMGTQHQCTMGTTAMGMMMEMDSSSKQISAVSETCAPCPWAIVDAQEHFSFLPGNGTFYAAALSHPAYYAQTEAQYRISSDRSRQKRGPPAVRLS